MNGRAIPGAYLFRLYVCDKEMSWPHHIGETHQPDWVVDVRDSEKFRLTNVIPERIIFVSRGITVLNSNVRKIWLVPYLRNVITATAGEECLDWENSPSRQMTWHEKQIFLNSDL